MADGKALSREEVQANGTWINDKDIIFETNDPNMVITCEHAKNVTFRLDVHELPPEAAADIAGKFKKNGKKRFF